MNKEILQNLVESSKDYHTVYHTAAKYSFIEILKNGNKYDLNVRDDNGRTPLHYAALKGNLKALKTILSHGGKINKCDYFGNSALHYAVRSKSLTSVSFLVHYEPRLIWMLDNNNFSSKQLAETLEYNDIVRFLNDFINKEIKLNNGKFYKHQLKEIKEAQKRREKYEKKMRSAQKNLLEEYKKESLNRFDNSGSQSFLSMNVIVIDENITLSSNACSKIKKDSLIQIIINGLPTYRQTKYQLCNKFVKPLFKFYHLLVM